MSQGNGNGDGRRDAHSFEIKVGLAEMMKGGVIMDVTDARPGEGRGGRRRGGGDGARAGARRTFGKRWWRRAHVAPASR